MIILIAGASHTGKTVLAPEDDTDLVAYLWPIVKEMLKTAIENQQNLVVEGAYIPFAWEKDFEQAYRKEIRYYCLIMTTEYLKKRFLEVKKYANEIEHRLEDTYFTLEYAIEENRNNLQKCKQHGCNFILIEDAYQVNIDL